MKRHWKSVTALVAAALVFVAVAAGATGGMGNGDFEHGDFTKWTTDATNATAWSVYSGNQTPIIGIPFFKPPQGSFAAVAEQDSEGQMVLYRTLQLGSTKTKQVSLSVYYQQDGGDFVPDLQEYRIDILRDGANPFSTDPGDILQSLFQTKPGDKLTMSPKQKTYVLSGLYGPVTLRFLVTVFFTELNAGVDNVTLHS